MTPAQFDAIEAMIFAALEEEEAARSAALEAIVAELEPVAEALPEDPRPLLLLGHAW